MCFWISGPSLYGFSGGSGKACRLLDEALGLGRTEGLVAGVVDAARLLLAPVVRNEHGEDVADEGGRRGRHEEGGDRPVVHAQARGELQGLSPAGPARGDEEDLLLHADVPQDPRPELPERREVDPAGLRDRAFQERVEAAVVGAEEAVERAMHDRGHTPKALPAQDELATSTRARPPGR